MPGCVSRSVPLPEAFAPNKKLDCLRSSAAWEAFLDYFDQFGTVDRLCDSAMSFRAASYSAATILLNHVGGFTGNTGIAAPQYSHDRALHPC
jgi:hypothetical protein